MPLLWNQPKLSWGIEVSTDQIHVVGLHDANPLPELCHEFSVSAPNAMQFPNHLNNPMAMGKHLAEVLRGRGVQQGKCCFALPEVRVAQLPLAPSDDPKLLQLEVERFVEQQVAEPAQQWAIDYRAEADHCAVAYCPKSLVNDYLLLASYTPLEAFALEPEGVAVERALRCLMPECVQSPLVVTVLMPRGCLWQVYSAQRLLQQSFMPWSLSSDALPYAGWAQFRADLRQGFDDLMQAQREVTEWGLLVAGSWAEEPELQAELSALFRGANTVANPFSALRQRASKAAVVNPVEFTSARYWVACGLALRACHHASF
jgi:Tfp pilus assembly PilM family ATPase